MVKVLHAARRDRERKNKIQRAAGVLLVAKSTGRVLLVKRSQHVDTPHTWAGISCFVEGSANRRSAMQVAVDLEVGYNKKLQFYPLFIYHSGAFVFRNHVAVVPTEFSVRMNDENTNFQWAELNKLPAPLHPGLRALTRDQTSMAKIQQLLSKQKA